MNRSPLTILVVTYNSAAFIDALLDSLPGATGALPYTVWVIDNGSSDDTVARVLEHRQVGLIESGGNVGYSAAINIGLERRPRDAPVAILNADLWLSFDSLSRLVGALDGDGSIGMVVPRLLGPGGSTYRHLRRSPTVMGALGDAIFGERWAARPRCWSEALRRDADYVTEQDVDWAGGAALVLSAACCAAVGPWDAQTYFLYAEEADYAKRVREQGFRVRFIPQSRVHHAGSGSGATPPLLALMSVNRTRFFEGWHGNAHSLAYRIALALRHVLRINRGDHRHALRVIVQRMRWTDLPSGVTPRPSVVRMPSRTGARQ